MSIVVLLVVIGLIIVVCILGVAFLLWVLWTAGGVLRAYDEAKLEEEK